MTDETLEPVELTQYLRPNGERTLVRCMLPSEVARKAEGMALSCEVLMSGVVVIYGRWQDEDPDDEYMETATNHEGPRQPDLMLAKVIERVALRRGAEHRTVGRTVTPRDLAIIDRYILREPPVYECDEDCGNCEMEAERTCWNKECRFFHSWFVDYEPGEPCEGCGEPLGVKS